ncbi:MAG: hypothetical protein EOP49_17310 [Sphingobacteriales bacterium]|nr:MAG: hypothetical protein EOP49_17310 [Sphingobacteriales bacterium]
MKIGRPFNTLTATEYFHYIDHHKKYTDFNTLGLYRSLDENGKLDLADKMAVRDYAHSVFGKFFNFLQLKDPSTWFAVSTLGRQLTAGDKQQLWEDIKINQEKILATKRIRHRNFGNYSKHNCGYADCHLNGVMIRQGSDIAENTMHFSGDKNRYVLKDKSDRRKSERKHGQHFEPADTEEE